MLDLVVYYGEIFGTDLLPVPPLGVLRKPKDRCTVTF